MFVRGQPDPEPSAAEPPALVVKARGPCTGLATVTPQLRRDAGLGGVGGGPDARSGSSRIWTSSELPIYAWPGCAPCPLPAGCPAVPVT